MSLKQLGRYEITGTLGRGAMGVVYQAHDPLIERTVAIKTVSYAGLKPEETEEFERRFFCEAKSAGRLNHPNIVTIHDVGRGEDLAYIAMELLSGQSLSDLLDSGVVLPTRRIVEIALRVANGLAFAHANGVIHRDIKPGNIMVLDNKIVKIADFGIALLPNNSLTMVGTAVGSPMYMSPEQVLGQKADGRSDIFSLGAVLYEMLTGRPPFTGVDLNAILYQVLNVAPPLPTSINPGLPAGFDRIVARALSKNPDKRYQSATEMATDLRNYRRIPGLMHSGEKSESAPVKPSAKPAASVSAGDSDKSSTKSLKSPLKPLSESPPPSTKTTASQISRLVRNVQVGVVVVMLLVAVGYFLRSGTSVPVSESVPSSKAEAETPADVPAPVPQKKAEPVAQALEVSLSETASQTDDSSPVGVAPSDVAEVPPLATEEVPKVDNQPIRTAIAERRAAKRKTEALKRAQKEAADRAALQNVPPGLDAPPPPPPQKHVPVVTWKTLLIEEVGECDKTSFLSKVVCIEKARWRHCPGHWGTDPCPNGVNVTP